MKTLRRLLITAALLLIGCALAIVLVPPLRYGPAVIPLLLQEAPQRLPVPVQGVRPAEIRDTWGAARPGGRRHEGTDIFAARETPILSATEGIVVFRGWNRLGGRVISILGPGGYKHYYAHLEGWNDVGEGDYVEAGDIIGFCGNSGNARTTPVHLHYGIYAPSGKAVNPYPLLRPE